MRRLGHRAYLMPLALLVSAVLVVTGLGFLGSQTRNYKSAVKNIELLQARSLAYAGVEDARLKLSRDLAFPPPGDQDQELFTYGESLTDVGSTQPIGTYTVTVDTTYAEEPYYVIVLTSEGVTSSLEARHTILAEIDVAPFDRTSPSDPNPDPYGILNWREEGLNL